MIEFNEKTMPKWPLLLLLFTSVDTLVFGTNSDIRFLYVPRLLGAIFVIVLPFMYSGSIKKIIVNKRDIYILLLMLFIMLISGIINSESIETLLSRLIVVLLAYVICHTYSQLFFAEVFDLFMFIVSIFTVLTEVLTYILPGLIMKLPTVTNTVNYSFYSFVLIQMQTTEINNTFVRANGIFWEPGAFAIYLIFALIIQLFVLNKSNIYRIIIYIVCILITFSTTGYLSLGVLIISYIFSRKSNNLSKKIKVIFGLLAISLIIICLIFDMSFLYDSVFAKILSGTSGATTRYSSFFNGMRIAFDHPFFGVSSNTAYYMSKYVYSADSIFRNGGTSITNTIVGQFASYGILFGLIFVVGTFKFLYNHSFSKFEWLLLSLTVFMAYFGEKFFSFFPFVFVFYGFLNDRVDVYENSSD